MQQKISCNWPFKSLILLRNIFRAYLYYVRYCYLYNFKVLTIKGKWFY
jgi:hypothetical protein